MVVSNAVLPVDVAPGATSGTQFATTIVQTRSGAEFRNRRWQHPLRFYELAYNVRDRERVIDELVAFALERGGAHEAFRARDWSDYQVTAAQIGVGDGLVTWLRLVVPYGAYERRIMLPDPATVTITVDGDAMDPDDFVIDSLNGAVIFRDPPASGDVVAWTGEFHVPVRFQDDDTVARMLTHAKGAVDGIGVKEVRVVETIDPANYELIRDYMHEFDLTDLIDMFDALDNHINEEWYATN